LDKLITLIERRDRATKGADRNKTYMDTIESNPTRAADPPILVRNSNECRTACASDRCRADFVVWKCAFTGGTPPAT
jgi:hypothetical protein